MMSLSGVPEYLKTNRYRVERNTYWLAIEHLAQPRASQQQHYRGGIDEREKSMNVLPPLSVYLVVEGAKKLAPPTTVNHEAQQRGAFHWADWGGQFMIMPPLFRLIVHRGMLSELFGTFRH